MDTTPPDNYGPYSIGKQETELEDEWEDEGGPDSAKRLKMADSWIDVIVNC